MTQRKFTTESDDREYNSMYSAAINGTRKLNVVDDATGEIVETIIESGRPLNTKKVPRKYTPPEQMFTKLYSKVTDAILSKEIEGYEIVVLMNIISRISYQGNWVVDTNGVKMSLRSIAESADLDKNKMNATLETLQAKGFITITPINGKSNGVVLEEWIGYKG